MNFAEQARKYQERMENTIYIGIHDTEVSPKIITVTKSRKSTHDNIEKFKLRNSDKNPANYKIKQVELDKISD